MSKHYPVALKTAYWIIGRLPGIRLSNCPVESMSSNGAVTAGWLLPG